MNAVTVVLQPEHVRSLRRASDLLARLAGLGVDVELLVDDLGEIIDLARAERTHSVRHLATVTDDDGYDDDPHDRMSDLWDLRER